MLRLKKKLATWVSHSLLTPEQAKNISLFESSQSNTSWVIRGFLLLGVIVINIGIISVIAANWQNIPNFVKLFNNFFLLNLLAGGVYYAWQKKKPILSEVLIVFVMLFCLASIGLISQIYHTGGELYQALMLWSIITAGVAAISKGFFAPFIWVTGFLFAVIFTSLDSPFLFPIFHNNFASVIMMIPLLSTLMAMGCRLKWGNPVQDNGENNKNYRKALKIWTLFSGIVALCVSETRFLMLEISDPNLIYSNSLIPSYILAVFLLGLGLLPIFDYKKIQKFLLLTALGFYLLSFHLPLLEVKSKIIYALVTLVVLAVMALFLASLKQRRWFQFFLFALGLRFWVLYLQALGGLAATGVGLIVSGVLILSVTGICYRYHRQITNWAEELSA